jgi:type VI secretion system protein ImpE
MNARELYAEGRLGDAVLAMNDEVRSNPADPDARGFLAELLCVSGNLTRADKMLEALASQAAENAPGIALFRQLVRAEMSRQEFHTQGRTPDFLEEPDDVMKLHLRASIALREGNGGEAVGLLNEADEARPRVRGTLNGEAFEDLRDLDDLCAGFFEVLTTTGKYYWIPFEKVESLELQPPRRPRDLIWCGAGISVRGGPEGQVYLPALYAPTPDPDLPDADELRLARKTDWIGGGDAPVRGRGLRTFLVGEEARTALELRTLHLEPVG